MDSDTNPPRGGELDAMTSQLYETLRSLAHSAFAGDLVGNTLQPTALVNEACLKLLGAEPMEVRGADHLRALAAKAMRQVLVDHLRGRDAVKRGRAWQRVSFQGLEANRCLELDILELDEVLQRLEQQSAFQARIVEMRFFAGLSSEAIADVLGTSLTRVKAEWRCARAWLRRALDPDEG